MGIDYEKQYDPRDSDKKAKPVDYSAVAQKSTPQATVAGTQDKMPTQSKTRGASKSGTLSRKVPYVKA